jgi:hypothetical protein
MCVCTCVHVCTLPAGCGDVRLKKCVTHVAVCDSVCACVPQCTCACVASRVDHRNHRSVRGCIIDTVHNASLDSGLRHSSGTEQSFGQAITARVRRHDLPPPTHMHACANLYDNATVSLAHACVDACMRSVATHQEEQRAFVNGVDDNTRRELDTNQNGPPPTTHTAIHAPP